MSKIMSKDKKIQKKLEHFNYVNKAVVYLGFALIVVLTVVIANIFEVITLPRTIVDIIETVAFIIGTYLMASIFLKLTTNSFSNIFTNKLNTEHKFLIIKVYTGLLYLIATVFSLWKIGVTTDNLVLVLGLSATGITFAIRDILLSYLIWFMLLSTRPFRIGDYIKMEGVAEGVVKYIGIFYVVIYTYPQTFDNQIRIPNKLFLDKSIYNFGNSKVPLAINISKKVEYANIETKLKKLKTEISKIVKDSVEILIKSENNDKLNIEINTYCPPDKKNEMQTKIIIAALKIME